MGRALWIIVVLVIVALLLFLAFCDGGNGDDDNKRAKELPPIKEFVRAIHVHGVDYETASAYSAEKADDLHELLADAAWRPYWATIVTTLGMIGRDAQDDVEALTKLIEKPATEKLSRSEYQARQAAMLALGYQHYRSKREDAIDYLERSTRPSLWGPGRIKWDSPFGEGPVVLSRHFARLAIIGLGLTGTDRAEQVLLKLRNTESVDLVDEAFRTAERGLIDRAIESNGRIRKYGLAEYYRSGGGSK